MTDKAMDEVMREWDKGWNSAHVQNGNDEKMRATLFMHRYKTEAACRAYAAKVLGELLHARKTILVVTVEDIQAKISHLKEKP